MVLRAGAGWNQGLGAGWNQGTGAERFRAQGTGAGRFRAQGTGAERFRAQGTGAGRFRAQGTGAGRFGGQRHRHKVWDTGPGMVWYGRGQVGGDVLSRRQVPAVTCHLDSTSPPTSNPNPNLPPDSP